MNTTRRTLKTAKAVHTLKIAVTGSAGSGKSSVCERLRQLGLRVVSADELAREAVLPGTEIFKLITDHFGAQVVSEDGTLDRRILRRIMLNDDRDRKILERLIHPEIFRRIHLITKAAEENNEPAVVAEIPLLFETSAQAIFDLVLLVTADRKLQIDRLMTRDHVTHDSAAALLDAQMPDRVKIEQADVILNNQGTLDLMYKQVDLFYRLIVKKNKKLPKFLDRAGIM